MIESVLKRKREKKGISQQKLADLLGISQRTYSNIESGKSKASIDVLSKASEILEFNLLEELAKDGITINQQHNKIECNGVFQNLTSEKLISQYELRIQEKDELITFLKSQLKGSV